MIASFHGVSGYDLDRMSNTKTTVVQLNGITAQYQSKTFLF